MNLVELPNNTKYIIFYNILLSVFVVYLIKSIIISENPSGLYILKHEANIDSLIINENGTYYHSLSKNNKVLFREINYYEGNNEFISFNNFSYNLNQRNIGWDNAEIEYGFINTTIMFDINSNLKFIKSTFNKPTLSIVKH